MITTRLANSSNSALLREFTNTSWEHPLGLLLFENDKLISCAGFSYISNAVDLEFIFTAEERRHKGYGSLLLIHLLNDSIPKSLTHITAKTNEAKLFFEHAGFKLNELGRYSLPITTHSINKIKLALFSARISRNEVCAITFEFPIHPIRFTDTVYDKWLILKYVLDNGKLPQPFQHLQLNADQILDLPFDKKALTERLSAFRLTNNNENSRLVATESQLVLKNALSQELHATSLKFIQQKYKQTLHQLHYPFSAVMGILMLNSFVYIKTINSLADLGEIQVGEMNKRLNFHNSAFQLNVALAPLPRWKPLEENSGLSLGLGLIAVTTLIEIISNKISLGPQHGNTNAKVQFVLMQLVISLMRLYFILNIDVGIFHTRQIFNYKANEITALHANSILNDSQFALYDRGIKSDAFNYTFIIGLNMLLNFALEYAIKSIIYRKVPPQLVAKSIDTSPALLAEQQEVIKKLVGNEPELIAQLEAEQTASMKKMN